MDCTLAVKLPEEVVQRWPLWRVAGSWWRFDCIILFPLISNLINTYAISNYQYSFGNVFPQICAASSPFFAREEEKPLGLLALK